MELKDFFADTRRAALAFSGGADSSYLLYEAVKSNADVTAYYVRSQLQPRFEFEDAKRLCSELGVRLCVIDADILSCSAVAANPPDRCYHCKKRIMGLIRAQAARDGYEILIDGTNASDSGSDRPGMRVLREDGIFSPLRLCGITKRQVRENSRAAGLFTWDKPAYACLATRVRTGECITEEKLQSIEKSEDFLFTLGFSDFRVRCSDGDALLQFTKPQLDAAREKLPIMERELRKYFDCIMLDDTPREASV